MALKKLGTIVNFFGLKGQIKVSVTTSQAEERFKPGKKIIIKNTMNQDEEFTIKSLMVKNSRIVVIGLEGYDDINDIQWMIGRDIVANVRAPKGSFFFDDLIGMTVVNSTGELVGTVQSITPMPACNYLVINETLYIPFLLEKFIESVDKKEKRITLTPLGDEVSKQ
jgi:16S rRNA processing protein rimM